MSRQEKLDLLRRYNASLLGNDNEMAESVADETFELAVPLEAGIEIESIAMRKRRPVLAIQDGTTTLDFKDVGDVSLWKERLQKGQEALDPAIAAVGRIDLKGNPDYSWVGTGWLIHEHILVTNRHVAELFAFFKDPHFDFQPGVDGPMQASIDFLHEIERQNTNVFEVKQVRYIEPRPGLDLAFLEVEQIGGKIAAPIRLAKGDPSPSISVATIGYPAYDSRIPEPDLMEEIYGSIYDKKRLAPGAVTEFDDRRIFHNCTTLGGNSGSVVFDFVAEEAVGLHFSGSFLRTNFAVRADLVKARLDALLSGTLGERRERPRVATPKRSAGQVIVNASAPMPNGSTSITVPLLITVTLGAAVPATPGQQRSPAVTPGPAAPTSDDEPIETEAKAKPEDYNNREGYKRSFLGSETVDLPTITKAKTDILTFAGGKSELKYQHFSVVMNKERRMCSFSACNIDGARSKSSKRTAWRFDPRIPEQLQIMKECYGSSPKFSRGHMTRREDPAWGTPGTIQRGADDSMHVTNATPQMQAFNAPIWLALEDYALQHAREDDQKISVFTGPYFTKADPEMFGVLIPVKFWKVIAFIHDETGELCATGYEMSQEDNLEQPEFVFGDFVSPHLNISTQVAISSIETRGGISFGNLADVDPLSQEGIGEPRGPLLRPEQIRFF